MAAAAAAHGTAADRLQASMLLFFMPYLNEIKDSWEFAAVPLHFLAMGWPISLWGLTICLATLCRLPMNALVTWQGDWILAPLLMAAACCAAYMLANPTELSAVMLGVGAGHCCDTCQAEHSLCYRWSGGRGTPQAPAALAGVLRHRGLLHGRALRRHDLRAGRVLRVHGAAVHAVLLAGGAHAGAAGGARCVSNQAGGSAPPQARRL